MSIMGLTLKDVYGVFPKTVKKFSSSLMLSGLAV
jgi:hypothetical protein